MAVTALPFQVRDRAAYFPDADALVLADLHLGRGEDSAVALPLSGSVVERLADLVSWWAPTTVVLAGDVLHAFSHVSPAVASSFEALRESVGSADLRVVAGNHDEQLETVSESTDAVRLDRETVVCHGHEAPPVEAARYVVGHDHPAIVIEGRRRPCFLYAEDVYQGAAVLALPAFNPLARGTAVNRLVRGDPASPLLADVRAFAPVVWDEATDETLVFPPLSASGRFL